MLVLVSAALGMCVAALIDLIAGRLGVSRPLCYLLSLVSGAVACVVCSAQLAPPFWHQNTLVALLAYGSWWYVFLNIVQALESSLRVRLLREVDAAGGSISRAKLSEIYSNEALISLRRDRLIAGGAIVVQNGRMFVKSAGLKAIAAFFDVLKKIYLGRTSEFHGNQK